MIVWAPRIDETARVKYIGLVEALESDIKTRVLKPGDRLPPQRTIANELGIDHTTVTRGNNEAAKVSAKKATKKVSKRKAKNSKDFRFTLVSIGSWVCVAAMVCHYVHTTVMPLV